MSRLRSESWWRSLEALEAEGLPEDEGEEDMGEDTHGWEEDDEDKEDTGDTDEDDVDGSCDVEEHVDKDKDMLALVRFELECGVFGWVR